MLKVWLKADGFDPEKASASTWIFTIARRLLLEAFRRRGTAARMGLANADDRSPSQVPASLTAVSQRVIRDAVLQDVVGALRRLDEADRAVFLHCGLEGLPAPQAAELIGHSAEAIKKRWQRLRARLRLELPEGELLID